MGKMVKAELRGYALIGAGIRARDLVAELTMLSNMFPELGIKGLGKGSKPKAKKASKLGKAKPHWTQTAKGKALLSKRMKAQWKTGKLGAK